MTRGVAATRTSDRRRPRNQACPFFPNAGCEPQAAPGPGRQRRHPPTTLSRPRRPRPAPEQPPPWRRRRRGSHRHHVALSHHCQHDHSAATVGHPAAHIHPLPLPSAPARRHLAAPSPKSLPRPSPRRPLPTTATTGALRSLPPGDHGHPALGRRPLCMTTAGATLLIPRQRGAPTPPPGPGPRERARPRRFVPPRGARHGHSHGAPGLGAQGQRAALKRTWQGPAGRCR